MSGFSFANTPGTKQNLPPGVRAAEDKAPCNDPASTNDNSVGDLNSDLALENEYRVPNKNTAFG